METSTMIRQLRRTAKKHENDKLYTFDTNISLMCTDVANRLEELEKEKKEIRAKAIDEFARQLKESLNQEFPSNYESTRPYFSLENARLIVDDVAEQIKAGGIDG